MAVRVIAPPNFESKHSADEIWYELDWSSFLAALGSDITITTASWSVPTGISGASDTVVDGGTATRIKLTGGTSGTTYDLTCEITLNPSGDKWNAVLPVRVDDSANVEYT